jgi:glutathione S-transferase
LGSSHKPCYGRAVPIVLHRFPLSHYAEKVRVGLDYKAVDYDIVEHRPGSGQLAIYRLSGQRRIPVLVHDKTVLADSTEILLYLDRAFSDRRPLLPRNPALRAEALELEARLDDVIGRSAPRIFARHAISDQGLLDPLVSHHFGIGATGLSVVRGAAGLARSVFGTDAVSGALDEVEARVCTLLAELCDRLSTTRYLVGPRSPTSPQ